MKKHLVVWLLLLHSLCSAIPCAALASEEPIPEESADLEIITEFDTSTAIEEIPEHEETPVSDELPVSDNPIIPEESFNPIIPEESFVQEEEYESPEMPAPEEAPSLDGSVLPGPLDPSRTLTISILGDSVCAYAGWSEGSAADWSNSTIRSNAIYYTEDDIQVEDLWWYRAAEELGARILVNNSWSGGCVLSENEPYAGAGTEGWRSRCTQLHDDTGENAGEEPDIICVYLGKNDFAFHWQTVGSVADLQYESLIHENGSSVSYAEPSSSAEAYAIMIDKIVRRYPNADVYCFTLMPQAPISAAGQTILTSMNEIIRAVASHYGLYLVDMNDTGITGEDEEIFYRYMADILHPNESGHAAIAGVFLQAVKNHVPAFGIMAQPKNAEVVAGQDASFTIRASGSGLTYQWMYYNYTGKTWVSISGASFPTLSFSALTDYNGIWYCCVVKDIYGNRAVSDFVRLTVITPQTPIPLPAEAAAALAAGDTWNASVLLQKSVGLD